MIPSKKRTLSPADPRGGYDGASVEIRKVYLFMENVSPISLFTTVFIVSFHLLPSGLPELILENFCNNVLCYLN